MRRRTFVFRNVRSSHWVVGLDGISFRRGCGIGWVMQKVLGAVLVSGLSEFVGVWSGVD